MSGRNTTEGENPMAKHVVEKVYANPIDKNRESITHMIDEMRDMYLAITAVPEYFAVVDINRLQAALETFSQNLSELSNNKTIAMMSRIS
jgi:hypothetical protein